MNFRLLPLALLLLLSITPAMGAEPAPGATGNSLEDFFNAALEYSPTLTIARERWNIGSARKAAATGQLLPQINATGTISDNTREITGQADQEFTGERYALQVNQVLFNWQAFSARGQAALLEDQSEAEYYAELAQLLTDVADSYLLVLQAEDALESIVAEQEAMTNQINQIQTLFDLQLARITDLYDAQAQLAAIGAQRVNLESELALAQEGLRAQTGLETGELARLPETVTVVPLEGSVNEWLELARNNNRLIAARNYALLAADKMVSARRGAHLPRVSLVLAQQQANTGFDNIAIPQAETQYIGIDVQVPLFSGGATRAGVREAVSMRNIAESELRQIRLDLIEQTRLDYLQVKSGEARIAAGQVLATSTATSFDAMQRGFELGTVTSVEVLNALRDRFASERDLQRARYDHIRAGLFLRRDAGVLEAADILNVSRLLNASGQ